MDDEEIIRRGGDEHDIAEMAKANGADLTREDFEPEITSITYPNTALAESEISYCSKKNGYRFKRIWKNGEMAMVCWIQVYKYQELVSEIKESVCNLYFNE